MKYFFYFCMKAYVLGTNLKCLSEALQMSTHIFYGEIRKREVLVVEKYPLSGTMNNNIWSSVALEL